MHAPHVLPSRMIMCTCITGRGRRGQQPHRPESLAGLLGGGGAWNTLRTTTAPFCPCPPAIDEQVRAERRGDHPVARVAAASRRATWREGGATSGRAGGSRWVQERLTVVRLSDEHRLRAAGLRGRLHGSLAPLRRGSRAYLRGTRERVSNWACDPLAISGTFLHQSLAVRNKLGAAGSREGRDSARAGTGVFTPPMTQAQWP